MPPEKPPLIYDAIPYLSDIPYTEPTVVISEDNYGVVWPLDPAAYTDEMSRVMRGFARAFGPAMFSLALITASVRERGTPEQCAELNTALEAVGAKVVRDMMCVSQSFKHFEELPDEQEEEEAVRDAGED